MSDNGTKIRVTEVRVIWSKMRTFVDAYGSEKSRNK